MCVVFLWEMDRLRLYDLVLRFIPKAPKQYYLFLSRLESFIKIALPYST